MFFYFFVIFLDFIISICLSFCIEIKKEKESGKRELFIKNKLINSVCRLLLLSKMLFFLFFKV